MTTFPRFEMPDFKLPEFTLPSFDLPDVELPEVELPSAEQVAAFARDAAYAGVGLVVMTVERVRELNEQLLELFTTQLDETRDQLRAGVETIVERVTESIKS